MKKIKFYSFLSLVLIVTVFLYWAGLKGDYVFDDSVNILENEKLKVTHFTFDSLKAAYGSGDAGPLGRPISMLSFALNHYFTGFEPYYFKFTNLIIHLLNGILICFLSLSILNWVNKDKKLSHKTIYFLSLGVSFIWLIHPLNLTSVLYVVQRMTSLSTLFGLLALVFYCKLRAQAFTLKRTIVYGFLAILAFIFSLLSKESGALFIILLYWIELVVFQAKTHDGRTLFIFKLSLNQLMWIVGVVGAALLLYLIQPHFHPHAFLRRDFNLEERLLTESRVVFYYLKMFIYPQLNELSLYHDDYLISRSILNPITTLYSIIGLLICTLISVISYKKYPLILFAWGWFVISQLMESTGFSLELVHEHRMYFATIGFLIAILYYMANLSSKKLKPFIYLLLGVWIVNSAFVTWQRSDIWSNLVDHALYEAEMHPNSDRANYQVSRIYNKLLLNEKDLVTKQYYINKSYEYLDRSKQSYLPANGAWFAQIHLDSNLNKPVSNTTVDELVNRLKEKPFYNSNVSFLSSFINCQVERNCALSPIQTIRIVSAGLENPTNSPEIKSELYKLLALYFVSSLGEYQKAEEFLNEALKLKNDVNGHLLLTQVYRLQGKLKQANQQLLFAESLDQEGVWFKEINIEKRNLSEAMKLGK